MYRREKQSKQETDKPSKVRHNMSSFSSTLLDEIYRSSVDGNGGKTEDSKGYREKPAKKQGFFRANASGLNNPTENGKIIASSRRACLVEKWMKKDNDVLFFSSTSSSSDSSGRLSSAFFGSRIRPKVVSGSPTTRPKPVRTGGPTLKQEDYQNHEKKLDEDDLVIKSKSRALRIYSHLKKMKQPISPGARLTNFINTLFNHGNGKKGGNVDTGKGFRDMKSSSESSFSRSCLSKCSPKSREKTRDGIQRTVRFHPVSVIVDDEDSRRCGKKSVCDEDLDRCGRPPLPPKALAELKQSKKEKNRKFEEVVQKVLQGYNRQNRDDSSIFRKIDDGNDKDEDEDEDEATSDSSSDLFELDHLSLFSNNNFCEELPVYETTKFDSNRAM